MDIAEQVAQRLYGISPFMALEGQTQLGDSLKVMLLTADAVATGNGGLEERLVDTEQWHHQVFAANAARAYARSSPTSEGEHAKHQVLEVARSQLPAAVEASIAAVAENLPEDTEARLVLAPSYQVAAVWLTGAGLDDVIVSAVPKTLEDLKPGERLAASEFIKRLEQAEPIPGLGPPPDLGNNIG